jgi:hypothetical protein
MGSFFYGNDHGPNHMMFPYISSKMNKNILFEKSKFTHETETDAKYSTARVVLGLLTKDNGGYVYTYEVSFFGHYKEVAFEQFRTATLPLPSRKNTTKNWGRHLYSRYTEPTLRSIRRKRPSRKASILKPSKTSWVRSARTRGKRTASPARTAKPRSR